MRIQRSLSLVLARTLSACYEGSSFAMWRGKRLTGRLSDRKKEVGERTLPLSGQIHALSIAPALSGNH